LSSPREADCGLHSYLKSRIRTAAPIALLRVKAQRVFSRVTSSSTVQRERPKLVTRFVLLAYRLHSDPPKKVKENSSHRKRLIGAIRVKVCRVVNASEVSDLDAALILSQAGR